MRISTTCGCAESIKERNKKLRKDMTGQTFGYLYFIEPDEEETIKHKNTNTNASQLYWKCKCLNCGRTVLIPRIDFNKKLKKIKDVGGETC